jgi:hypothetical protein
MYHPGKIQSLSRPLRDQLNRRIHHGECGRRILEWLNSQPEVLTLLHRDFEGRDINDQNFSDWKLTGYREWLLQEETMAKLTEFVANSEDLAGCARGRISDHLCTVVAARIAAELASWSGGDDSELRRRIRVLRELCRDAVELRRSDLEAAYLSIAQSRENRTCEQTEEALIEHFQQWLSNSEVRNLVLDPAGSPEAQLENTRKALGLSTGDPTPPPPA